MTVWIKELLKSLDMHTDEVTRKSIMGACGEKCSFTHLPDDKLLEIKKESQNEKVFLESLCNQWHLKNESGQYFVVFDQCYCPLVNKNLEGVSKTLCFCTLGSIKHKFKIGLGKEVEVDLQKSILAGDDECRFHVKLENA